MKRFTCLGVVVLTACYAGFAQAEPIKNPGFESAWDGWVKVEQGEKSIAISGDAKTGEKAAKITKSTGYFAQSVPVSQNANYAVNANVMGAGILGVKVGENLYFERQKKSKKWKALQVKFNSEGEDNITIFAQYNGSKGLFDDFSIEELGGELIENDSAISVTKDGLSPDLPPSKNFDLLGWHLTVSFDKNGDGIADTIDERALAKGYEHEKYFYTGSDGGMVFAAPNVGAKTSKNTKYTRTELREMLRRGDRSISTKGDGGVPNKNNWVFSTAPKLAQRAAGGVDGALKATLAVNKVSETGSDKHIGRIIVGQIHAKDNEPIRVYYRKLPGNTRGSIYAAHETANGDERWYELLGSRANKAADPEDGIALNEKFSYEILAAGNSLQLVITQNGKHRAVADIDMTESGYDVRDDYMYFKAGLYNQNNSGDPDELSVVTFYDLESAHVAYGK